MYLPIAAAAAQILLEPITFKGIHNKLEEMDVTEVDVSDLAALVNQVGACGDGGGGRVAHGACPFSYIGIGTRQAGRQAGGRAGGGERVLR